VAPTTTLPSSSRRATASSLRIAPTGRRRSTPWIALGVLLVLGCALTFGVISTRLGERQAVLAITRPIPAGQIVTAGDLATVHVTVDPGLTPIPVTARSSVVGRPAAVPLVPGALLTPAQLGAPSTLAPDQAVVALALKAGRFPPGLSPGAHVLVADTGAANETTAAVGSSPVLEDTPLLPSATVVEVDRPTDDTQDSTVVSLRVPATSATRLAAAGAADRVALVLLAPSKS
jgi:hypothetical protein